MLNENDSYLARLEILYAAGAIQAEMTRPFFLARPTMEGGGGGDFFIKYGDRYIYGKTPEECAANFDKFWKEG